MAYDIFSQPTGPVIPISLFSDAASAGINAGNALPTQLTAGIQGAIKGYDQGLDFVGKQNANALSSEKVAEIPTDRALKETQLQNDQSVAQINKIKAGIDVQTEALQLDNTKAKLINDTSKNQDELNDRTEQTGFEKSFTSADPRTQAQMVLGGQYTPFFAKNPKAYTTYLQSVAFNPNNGLDDGTRDALKLQLRKGAVSSFYDHKAFEAQQALKGLEGQFENNSLTDRLVQKTDYDYSALPDSVEFAYPGTYQVDSAGYKKTNDVTKAPLAGEGVDKSGGVYQVFDRKTGRLLDEAATPEDRKLYEQIAGKKAVVNGTMKNRALAQVDRQRNVQQPQSQSGGSFQPTATGSPTTDPYKTQAQKVLAVPEDTFKRVEPSLDLLKSKVVSYISDPKLRNTPAGLNEINKVTTTIGRTISDNEFDSTPALQAQFTQSHVDEYNRSIDEGYGGRSIWSYMSAPNETGIRAPSSMANAFKLSTPKDLYYVNQQAALTVKMNALVKALSDQETSRKNSVIKGVQNKKSVTGFLAAISNTPQG